ncbi:hypothetical protein [Mesorhizobium sp. M4B.F.Ca.ET.143.01.1.1]|uniref:hypothetical protein n=1 Tax=Mesorhizobium sp. M4B.F.Ca.ET.143.01.1.1 TaxID=2563947 RepID=UPI0010936565|nr:hypothetical protein [Mesorhizobium sp. M4B.F.Ca.ET.143.01.1.1]TGV26365.1 hypothetical protein EN786_12655 [Mesorhizobium sp. M4B.F.Ca.ET.143.01.1.1]
MAKAPDRIRVAQDEDGFWTCREAVSGSPEYINADVANEVIKDILASLVASVSLLKRGNKKAAPSDKMFDIMISDYEKSIERARRFLS